MEKQESDLSGIISQDSEKDLALQSIESSYDQTPKERTFTEQQLVEIISYATGLRDEEESRKRKEAEIRAQIPISLPQEDKRVIPSKALYRIASDLEIPRKYVERAVKSRFPSKDTMLEDIARYGAKQSSKVIDKIRFNERLKKEELLTRMYIEKLTNILSTVFSFDRFVFEVGGIPDDTMRPLRIYRLTKEKTGFLGLLGIKRIKKEMWAYIQLWQGGTSDPKVVVETEKPEFLSSCGETLEELRAEFGLSANRYCLEYNYDIEQ